MQEGKMIKQLEDSIDSFLDILEKIVRLESPTFGEKEALIACSDFIVNLFESIGGLTTVIEQEHVGPIIKVEIGNGAKSIMLLGHYDTVYQEGMLAKEMPFKIEGNKVYGPGVLDMKGGIVSIFFAVKTLMELDLISDKKIVILFSSDEESGSEYSKDVIVEEALDCKAVLVLEPAPANKDASYVKSGRYGRATYKIIAHGKAAHSGNNPGDGISSLVEISKQVLSLEEMNRKYLGMSAAPIYVSGGDPSKSMVPDEAQLVVDMRFQTIEVANTISDIMKNLTPFDDGITLEVIGGMDKPVFEANEYLVETIRKVGDEFGLIMHPEVVGGGSDGNFTSGAGIPTLDGLGLTGNYLHNQREHIYVDEIPLRIAMLARLIQTL